MVALSAPLCSVSSFLGPIPFRDPFMLHCFQCRRVLRFSVISFAPPHCQYVCICRVPLGSRTLIPFEGEIVSSLASEPIHPSTNLNYSNEEQDNRRNIKQTSNGLNCFFFNLRVNTHPFLLLTTSVYVQSSSIVGPPAKYRN